MGKREVGIQRMRQIVGDKTDDIIRLFEEISPDFTSYMLEFGYGNLYARKGLSDKHRELAAVACLVGQGNAGLSLKTHLQGMLNVGWSKEEIIELLIFLVGYAGFPSSVQALTALQELSSV